MGDGGDAKVFPKLKSLIALWALFVASVKAEIRCYCNQPSCVSTGYMCKSNSGVCFTELFSYSMDLSKSRHGCVELLIPKKQIQCRPPAAIVDSLPAVICCKEDMCNYISALDINIQVHTNHSQAAGSFDYTKERHAYEAALQKDVWFKAAVIAVPIAGGFILIMLILLATRMLRQDSKRQRQLLELRQQQQQRLCNKHQCLVAQSYHPNCGSYVKTVQDSNKVNHAYGNSCAPCDNWYADTIASGERQYVYEPSSRNSICASLLPWAKVHKQKPLTHV